MKFFKHLFLGLFFSVLLSVNMQAQASLEKPKVEHYKLPNGLTVIVQVDHRLPKVHGVVVVRAGSINDPEDATGLAHYLEHMMFKGTQEMGTIDWPKEKVHYDKIVQLYEQLGKTSSKKERESIQLQINEESLKAAEYAVPNEFSKLLDNIGCTYVNAGTGKDQTSYFSTFPSSQVERWLSVYSQIFENPVFRGFQAELENVYEEYNMYADRQQTQLSEILMKNIFKQTPYGRDIIGYADHLKNPSLTKLQKFFEDYYVPSNMALVLCGDIDMAKVKPLIETTFGKWPAKAALQESVAEEAPFKGRELMKVKGGNFDFTMLDFRGVPQKHEDNLLLSVCTSILNNGQSGLLDQYSIDNTALGVSAQNSGMKNAGVIEMTFIPNAQSYYDGPDFANISSAEAYKNAMREMERARIRAREAGEGLMLSQLKRLKEGDYPDWILESVKTTYINSYIRRQESILSRANELSLYFSMGKDLDEYLNYIERVKAITKDDIAQIAKKYFTDNYLVFQVTSGTIRTKPIEKPEYKPLVFPNAEKPSAYAQAFYKIPTPEQAIPYIDFDKDVKISTLRTGPTLHYSVNPITDFFSLTVRFGAGVEKVKELEYVGLLNFAGAGGFDVQNFKSKLAELNTNLNVASDESYTYVRMQGPGANFTRALSLLNTFITRPALYDRQVSRLAESQRYSRKTEQEEPKEVADALEEYVRYGQKSSYLDRITIKEMRSLKAANIVAAFKTATEYETAIFYNGTLSEIQLKMQLEQSLKMSETTKKSEGLIIKEDNKVTENTIYFVNFPSLQSQVRLFANGKAFNVNEQAIITAFNSYFSGGFTGLVLQELRENHSLAYGAGAVYRRPPLANKPSQFEGEVQTQSDKTLIALDLFMDLIRDMPKKTERVETLKRYLELSAVNRPDFREYAQYIENSKLLGYTDDPMKTLMPSYKNMTLDDIYAFWQANIKDAPMAIMIVGNKKNIDMKALAKYGKIVEIKLKDIFSKDEE
jgi:predicted Zn-dependent peptidase